MEEREEKQKYPIDERCKDCPLFQVVEEMKKEIAELKAKVSSLEKELEKYRKPPKDSSNSSIPPSQNCWIKKYPPKEKSNRKAGGQDGHKGINKSYTNNPDERIYLNQEICPYCGETHFIENKKKSKRKQLVSIEIVPHTTEYVQRHLICANCKRKIPNKPFKQNGNNEYDDTIKALTGYMNVQCNMSFSRIKKFFKEICNVNISEGSLDNMMTRLAEEQRGNLSIIQAEIQNSEIIGSDETSIRVNKKNKSLWIMQNKMNSLFFQGKRSFKTLLNVLGTDFAGIWVSDRYGAQLKVKCKHQLCLAHIIRGCKYLVLAENTKFARHLKRILKAAIHFKNKYGDEYNPLNAEIFRGIQKLKRMLNKVFEKPPKEKLSLTLWRSLIGRLEQLFLFLTDKNIPPTNNASERGLRNAVTKRKVSGGFRSETGADRLCAILSIIETAKKQSINVLSALMPDFSFA